MKKNELVLPHNFTLRAYQRPLWNYLEGGGKRAIACWHRRAGKDQVCLHFTAVAAMQRPGNYWYLLPLFAQARKAIWGAVNPHTGKRRIDEAFPQAIRETTNESEMFIRFKNGSTFQLVGSDTYDTLVGSPPCGIVFSEWSRANPAAWAYLAPILAENDGWAAFVSTPLGRNHMLAMIEMARKEPAWFSEIVTVNDSNAISADAVAQQRKEYRAMFGEDAGDALIDQEYFCSFAAPILGAFYGREMNAADHEGRICKIDPDYTRPFFTAWDIGIDDPMAVWVFQIAPGRIDVVDYTEGSGQGVGYYCDWLNERRYHGVDFVPHDAKTRDPGSGRSRIFFMLEKGRKPKTVSPHSVMDGIQAGRLTLPLSYFDAERCAKGLEALRAYQTEWDEDARTFKKTPKHDWSSHAADAWRYLSVGWREPIAEEDLAEQAKIKARETIAEMLRPKTLDEVLALYDGEQRELDDSYQPYHEIAP
jgi:phage terminase large subunit